MHYAKRVQNENGKWKWNYDAVPKFRYYVCGEYGSVGDRPHYHALVFGLPPEILDSLWQGKTEDDYDSGEVDSCILGSTHIGSVTGASIGYTLKYMAKGKTVPKHDRDDRVPEFAMMSKRLGANYLTKEVVKHHRDSDKIHLTNPDGYTISMPRYYKQKIWNEHERRKLGSQAQELHDMREKKRQEAFIKRTGSLDGYTKSQHESKKAAINNSRAQASAKRNKI